MIVLREKIYGVYDGNEFWEELIGKKIPKQLYTLTEIEKRYPRIREILSDENVPMSPGGDHKLDIFNDDLLVNDDKYLMLIATPDGISGGDLLWYFKKKRCLYLGWF